MLIFSPYFKRKEKEEKHEFISPNLGLKNIFLIRPDLIVQYFAFLIRSLNLVK